MWERAFGFLNFTYCQSYLLRYDIIFYYGKIIAVRQDVVGQDGKQV